MTFPEMILTHPEILFGILTSLAWITVKSGLIVGLALLIVAVFRRASAARLHLVLCAAMVAVLILPLLAAVFPDWQVSLLKNLPAPLTTGNGVTPEALPTVGTVTGQSQLPWSFWALSLWFLGTQVVLGRAILGLIATARIVGRTTIIDEPDILALKESCRERLRVNRPVRLVVCPGVASPFVWGILRPVIVLPEAARRWSEQDLRYVLLHELAHIRRLDFMWTLATTIAAAVYWMNPMIWMVKKQLIIEAEKTCDDCVLNAGTDGASYAQHLLKVLDLLRKGQRFVPMGVGMARRSHMEGRLMSILSDRKRSAGLKRSALAVAILMTAIFVLPLAGMKVMAEQEVDTAKEQVLPGPNEFVPVDVFPEMVYSETPKYPDSAAKVGLEGVVWIKALVDKKGDVVKAMIHKSSGHKILDDSALEAAHKNRYKAAIQGEDPVMVWISYKINFTLDDDAQRQKENDG